MLPTGAFWPCCRAHLGNLGLDLVDVRSQQGIAIDEDQLVELDDDQQVLIDQLLEGGLSPDQIRRHAELRRIKPRKQEERRAGRSALDDMVRHETGRILAEKGINPRGKNLDKQHRDRPNFVVVKAAIDKEIAALLDCQTGERHDYRRDELEMVRAEMRSIIERASKDIF